MDWTRTTERQERVAANISPFLDGMDFSCASHVFADYPMNASRCRNHVESNLLGDVSFNRLPRKISIDHNFAAEAPVGIEIPQHHRRVRHRSVLAATPITR